MNVKPGDLAYIVGDFPEAGLVVEVISFYGLGRSHIAFGLPLWNVRSSRPLPCRGYGEIDYHTDFQHPDVFLRPISGVPTDDETPVETNIPEAVTLAWGIYAPVLA